VDRRWENGGPLIVICFGVRGSDFCQEYLSLICLLMHLFQSRTPKIFDTVVFIMLL